MFKEVLTIDPSDEMANLGLTKIFLEQGLFFKAENQLKTLLEKNNKKAQDLLNKIKRSR